MKVVIADGRHEADYLIHLFNSKNNDLLVINEDENTCEYLSLSSGIPVMRGRCTRETDLKEAGAEFADLFIALSEDDYKNYVACKLAKKHLSVKRCIATVKNPKNVGLFKSLGLDSVVCSTYLLGEQVRNISSIENLINTLSLENEKIFIAELRLGNDLDVLGKSLSQIAISDKATVASITREGKVIIPNGQTVLKEADRVILVTTLEHRDEIVKILQRKRS